MSYRDHVNSLEPVVYKNWQDEGYGSYGYEVPLEGEGGGYRVIAAQTGSLPAFDYELPETFFWNPWTVAFWARSNTSATDRYLQLSRAPANSGLHDYRFRIELDQSDALRVWWKRGSNNYSSSRNALGSSGINHWVVMYQPVGTQGNIQVYCNGVRVYDNTSTSIYNSGPAGNGTSDVLHVEERGSDRNVFHADVALWDRALTVEEIRSLSVDYVGQAEIEHIVSAPADADAEFIEPASYGPADRTIDVTAMAADAAALDASVIVHSAFTTTAAGGSGEMLTPTLNPDLGYVVDFKATSVRWADDNNYSPWREVNSERVEVSNDLNGRVAIYLPALEDVLHVSQDIVQSLAFVMQLDEGHNSEGTVIRVNPNAGGWFDMPTSIGPNRIELNPDATSLRINPQGNISFDNPKWEENSDSYFTVVATPAVNIDLPIDIADGAAESLDVAVEVGSGPLHLAGVVGETTSEFPSPTLNEDLGYAVTGYASDAAGSSHSTLGNYLVGSSTNNHNTLRIYLPDMDATLIGPHDNIQAIYLNVYVTQLYGAGDRTMLVLAYINGTNQTVQNEIVRQGTNVVAIPSNADSIVLRQSGEMNKTFRVSDPMDATGKELTNFTVVATADPGAYPNHEAFVADAQMLGASVDTTVGVSIAVAPFTVLGTVGNVIFPDWEQQVAPATGAGEMEDAWFKSEYRFRADSVTIDGEMLDPTTGADRNTVLEVASMHSEGNIFNPDEVSDDVNDRFFDEIAKDRPDVWRRFNERVHEPAGAYEHSHNGRGALRTFTGEYTRGHVGVGGRRAIDIDNAFLPTPNVFPTRTDGRNHQAAALEFVIKTTADHGILAAYTSHWTYMGGSGGAPGLAYGNSSTFIKDGYLFQQRGQENDHIRLSASRINDGQWHHIVLNSVPSPFTNLSISNRQGIEVWIDGVRDRTVFRGTGSVDHVAPPGADHLFAPGRYADDYTSIPFEGQVMEFAGYTKSLHEDRILAHWRALADIIPVKAGRPATGIGAMGDHEADSNMSRMLILTWSTPSSPGSPRMRMEDWGGTDWQPVPTGTNSVTPGWGFDDVANLGDIHITYQNVRYVHDPATVKQGWSAVGWDSKEMGHSGQMLQFINDNTGLPRLINLQEDIVDIDDFDIIYIQNYPNPANRTQDERVLYEEFLTSVKQAIVDGSKFWISNPALAADLNLIGRFEAVPTVWQRFDQVSGQIKTVSPLDPRSWQTFPMIGQARGANPPAKEGVYPWPENIQTREQASEFLAEVLPVVNDTIQNEGPSRVHKVDSYANNRFRVVNEVAGLTDYPSWFVIEAAQMRRYRDQHQIPLERGIFARRYENRMGEDHPFNYGASEGTGLQVGDEFLDWAIQENANAASTLVVNQGDRNRGYRTFAVPPGELRAGRAVTTFGATTWNDAGYEVPNNYRNHITTAVIQPGDRIEGRQVGGYVFMQFSEDAQLNARVRTLEIDRNPYIEDDKVDELLESGGHMVYGRESAYTLSWHYASGRAVEYSSGGTVEVGGLRSQSKFKVDSNGKITHESTEYYTRVETLPIANRYESVYGAVYVPYTTWTFRGIQWLKLAEPQTVGAVNTYGEAATASGSMRDVTVYAEADRIIRVDPARGNGQIVPAAGVAYRDALVDVYAATGTATMQDPGRVVSIGAMNAIAEMPRASARVELGTIEWLTVYMSRDMINLRVEETAGTPPASSALIQGEVISGGQNTGGNDE